MVRRAKFASSDARGEPMPMTRRPRSSLAAASAAVSGRNYQDVLHLLESPAAHDDASLLELANTLQALEKEVRGT